MKHRNDQTVCIAYPYATQMSSRFAHSKDRVLLRDAGHRRRIRKFGFNSSGANVATPRNEIVREFVASDIDYLWFIDTDMVFEDDVLERLIERAHPVERPIVGALCFSLQNGMKARPTIYRVRGDRQVGVEYDYPVDKLYEVDATGTGCLLIHRSVFEKMDDNSAYPWFRESSLGNTPIGEDITFCIRARALGFPIYVDTSIKVGHEKTFVVDEDVYLAQRRAGIRQPADPTFPTFAVIASKDRPEMLARLVEQLRPQCCKVFVFDNGYDSWLHVRASVVPAHGWPLHAMWNHGLEHVGGGEPHNVLIINDDVEVAPDFVAELEAALRSDENAWLAVPGDGQMTGWAFMLRGEANLRFDEQFAWWYGDTDMVRQVQEAGKKVVCAPNALANHLDPMRSTLENPERLAQAIEDENRYAAKWGIDPSTLWLHRKGYA